MNNEQTENFWGSGPIYDSYDLNMSFRHFLVGLGIHPDQTPESDIMPLRKAFMWGALKMHGAMEKLQTLSEGDREAKNLSLLEQLDAHTGLYLVFRRQGVSTIISSSEDYFDFSLLQESLKKSSDNT
ncbi:hypothetical protein SAMN05216327_101233 [Dyadobacter sp. SG02]|uniref:hypothetical protein n=1 Tax=Dyadobacter sp. SG02 TaxID=1855291 RepID=UPI0008B5AD30|nr:hypothetical protein [Dyadobacter sp. SG02]SEI39846.1 hypothetical protein SAMN05216327_101233 [Dyadobacter sp. SG02]